MKLEQLLQKQTNAINKLKQTINALKYIEQHCDPAVYNTINLYRGNRTHGKLAFEKEIRQDRKSRDTTLYANAWFNYYFELLYNVSDIRKKILFCTTDFYLADSYYPSVYFIFPYKGANYYIYDGNDSADQVIDSSKFVAFIDDNQTLSQKTLEFISYKNDKIKTVDDIKKILDYIKKQDIKAHNSIIHSLKNTLKDFKRVNKFFTNFNSSIVKKYDYPEIGILDDSCYLLSYEGLYEAIGTITYDIDIDLTKEDNDKLLKILDYLTHIYRPKEPLIPFIKKSGLLEMKL